MDVKQAVDSAKKFIRDIYADEKIENLGLEEVDYVDGGWDVTLGFSRPWDRREPGTLQLLNGVSPSVKRALKKIRIEGDGTVKGPINIAEA